MPWKLIAFILVACVVVFFVGFNIDNKCDISVIFTTMKDVPVIITIMCSYIVGLLSALVFSFNKRNKNKAQGETMIKDGANTPSFAYQKEKNIKKPKSEKKETASSELAE